MPKVANALGKRPAAATPKATLEAKRARDSPREPEAPECSPEVLVERSPEVEVLEEPSVPIPSPQSLDHKPMIEKVIANYVPKANGEKPRRKERQVLWKRAHSVAWHFATAAFKQYLLEEEAKIEAGAWTKKVMDAWDSHNYNNDKAYARAD